MRDDKAIVAPRHSLLSPLATRDGRWPLLTGVLVSLLICMFALIVTLAAGSPLQIVWCAVVALVTMLATPFAVLNRAAASLNRR